MNTRQSLRHLLCMSLLAIAGCTQASEEEVVTSLTNGGLSPIQKRRAEQITSVFENDTIELQYAYIENINDGRGYTAGRAGFTSATGDLLEVVERYTTAVPGNGLAVFLPTLRQRAASNSDDVTGLGGLPAAWVAAAADPIFRSTQDAVSDENYYLPAVEHGRELGLKTALAIAALYDASIQHGDGDDPDGVPAMIARTNARAGGSPATGVDERIWLAAFLDVRRETLAFANDPDTREAWAQVVERVDPFREQLSAGNLGLDGPIEINTADHQATIP